MFVWSAQQKKQVDVFHLLHPSGRSHISSILIDLNLKWVRPSTWLQFDPIQVMHTDEQRHVTANSFNDEAAT